MCFWPWLRERLYEVLIGGFIMFVGLVVTDSSEHVITFASDGNEIDDRALRVLGSALIAPYLIMFFQFLTPYLVVHVLFGLVLRPRNAKLRGIIHLLGYLLIWATVILINRIAMRDELPSDDIFLLGSIIYVLFLTGLIAIPLSQFYSARKP